MSNCLDSETFSTAVFGKPEEKGNESPLLGDNERHDIESVMVMRHDSQPLPPPSITDEAPECVVVPGV